MKKTFSQSASDDSMVDSANDLLDTALSQGLKSAAAEQQIAGILSQHRAGISACLAVVHALERDAGVNDAIEFGRTLHKVVLEQKRDELVGFVMLAQAQIFGRNGEGMAKDLYAVEAASAFAESNLPIQSQMALEIISPSPAF